MGVDMMCPYKTCADLVWRNRLGQNSPHDPPPDESGSMSGARTTGLNSFSATTYPKLRTQNAYDCFMNLCQDSKVSGYGSARSWTITYPDGPRLSTIRCGCGFGMQSPKNRAQTPATPAASDQPKAAGAVGP